MNEEMQDAADWIVDFQAGRRATQSFEGVDENGNRTITIIPPWVLEDEWWPDIIE